MGIYADIQADVKEAMLDDLADAVAVLTVTEANPVYDPDTGEATDTPIVYTMDCIIVDDKSGEDIEDSTTTDYMTVLVLDSDKTTDLNTGIYISVRGKDYEVSGYELDPAGATHTLKCRRK